MAPKVLMVIEDGEINELITELGEKLAECIDTYESFKQTADCTFSALRTLKLVATKAETASSCDTEGHKELD